jgi:hypothetical protein
MKFLLTVALATLLSGCFASRPVTPTELRTAPAACTTQCAPGPVPPASGLKELAEWAEDYMDSFRECRLLHKECVDWQTKTAPQP